MKIENKFLPETVRFLNELKLARMYSVHRRRLVKLISGHVEEFEEDRQELLKDHAEKDDKNEPIIKGDSYDIKDMKKFSIDMKKLNAEHFHLDNEKNKELIKTMQKSLHQFIDIEYSGVDSEIYDELCDVFNVDELGYKEEIGGGE